MAYKNQNHSFKTGTETRFKTRNKNKGWSDTKNKTWTDTKTEINEIEYRIIESYGKFSQGNKSWNKEVKLISWNGMPAKLDIRNWQKDHQKCGKGIAVTRLEAEELIKLLNKILKQGKSNQKTKQESNQKTNQESNQKTNQESNQKSNQKPNQKNSTKTAKKKLIVPQSLEPFYDELEMVFGLGPEECKSARNTLLKKYHPDKNAANISFATRKTIRIKEAYERLMAFWQAVG